MIEDNYERYFEKYQSCLISLYGSEYYKHFNDIKEKLCDLPIVHTTNIKHLDSILQLGLLPFSTRRPSSYADTAIFESDKNFGLDNFVFAKIGHCPSYGSSNGSVSILLDDSIIEQPNSFFTFYDITALILFNERNSTFLRKVLSQLPYERLPLNKIYDILSFTFLLSGKKIEDFLNSKLPNFPPAYNPDFESTNHGNPEIKIAGGVNPDKFIGFVVWEDETKNRLINYGVPLEKIIVLSKDISEKRVLYEYKSNYVKTAKII